METVAVISRGRTLLLRGATVFPKTARKEAWLCSRLAIKCPLCKHVDLNSDAQTPVKAVTALHAYDLSTGGGDSHIPRS